MAAPTIQPLPAAPLPTDSKSAFDSKAFALVGALEGMVTQINALVTWMNANVGAQPILTISASSYDLLANSTGAYHVFTSGSAKTVNVRPNATHALPAGYTITAENQGLNDLTLVAGSGVTIRPPAGGTLVIPSGGAFTLIRTGSDSFKLIGDTVAA